MKFETEESDLEDVCYESRPDPLASARVRLRSTSGLYML